MSQENLKLTYAKAAEIKWELMQLDLSYVSQDFNVRALRLIVQEHIVGIADALRSVEPQQKEINELMADYSEEANTIDRKYSINVKDVLLDKEERKEYEKECAELKNKYKEEISEFKKKSKELEKVMNATECSFSIKKTVKEDMLPSNISARDMSILSRLINWESK